MSLSKRKKTANKLLGTLSYVEEAIKSLNYSDENFDDLKTHLEQYSTITWAKIDQLDIPHIEFYKDLKKINTTVELYGSPKQSLGDGRFYIRVEGVNLKSINLPKELKKKINFRSFTETLDLWFPARISQEEFEQICSELIRVFNKGK